MTQKHIHKFKRHRHKTGNVIFFCSLPDCSVKINPALALGKRSICWRCGNDFLMTEYSLRLAKPHCESCHKPKKIVDLDEINISSISVGESLMKDVLQIKPAELSLSDRLSQTIQQAQEQEEEL